jgi:beta-galactosidase
MRGITRSQIVGVVAASAYVVAAHAAVESIDASNLPATNQHRIIMGTAKNPSGSEITINGTCISIDGKPWLPVMGEFHYSRYPQDEWRDEILKMKAGGINIVSCYVFWIHHEEVEGRFDWSGQRDLHKFVQLCGELGMRVVVRCGPWDHGEVRNGGYPEWLLDKGYKLRSDDAGYLKEVEHLYSQIAEQLKGSLWKDGGPVIGIQVENEYWGPPQHLLTLKKLAVDAGIDVPIYTRTGWPELPGPIEFGQLLPLYSGYAEGFWDRELTTMPGDYWKEFIFQAVRTDTAVASEHFGKREAKDEADAQQYPYLTCELGAGMMSSYHRRITVLPQDCISVAMVKLGSGSNLPGYYMYHGGTNPDSKTGISLEEAQATKYTNYNDLPTKTYDFQTALGEFGQVRPQYHLLRRLHLFLNDFGPKMTAMAAVFPNSKPSGKSDATTLRWSVRTDGQSGFIFVNNYQRLQSMPAKPDTQFKIQLSKGEMMVPAAPVSVPADSTFLWPFNLDLGGVKLIYATAQPVCFVDDGDTRYTVFITTGVPPEFVFDAKTVKVESRGGTLSESDGRIVVTQVKPGTGAAIELRAANGKLHRIILLDDATSLKCWKGSMGGKDRIFLTNANLLLDQDKIRLLSTDSGDMSLSILPAPATLFHDDQQAIASDDGLFRRFTVQLPRLDPVNVIVNQTKEPGPPREISMGRAKVAQSPGDADFDQAGIWKITLPSGLDPNRHLLLRVHYSGDVARAYCGDELLTDNFYNGTPFDIGVNRFGNSITGKGLTLKILPLRKDAPIYMLDNVRPDFAGQGSIAKLANVEVVEEREAVLATR